MDFSELFNACSFSGETCKVGERQRCMPRCPHQKGICYCFYHSAFLREVFNRELLTIVKFWPQFFISSFSLPSAKLNGIIYVDASPRVGTLSIG